MATAEQIRNIKAVWLNDPTWDIEDTEGFEDHREELLAYRLETEARWESEHKEQLVKKAEEIGCPGNLKLAEYVMGLERRIAAIDPTTD